MYSTLGRPKRKTKIVFCPVFYTYAVEKGRKIGYSTNFKNRLKNHNSSGHECEPDDICYLPTEGKYAEFSKKIDDNLKRILNKYRVVGSKSAEVYELTKKSVNKLFEYLREPENIDTIMKMGNEIINIDHIIHTLRRKYERVEMMRIGDIKHKMLIGQFKNFSLNRALNEKRVDEIKDYIEKYYDSPLYIMPELIFVKDPRCNQSNAAPESTIKMVESKSANYILIDGQHRLNAFCRIIDEDILNMHTTIKFDDNDLDEDDIRIKYLKINKSVPLNSINMTDEEIAELNRKIAAEFCTIYGNIMIDSKKISFYVSSTLMEPFQSNQTLNELYKIYSNFSVGHLDCIKFIKIINADLINKYRDMEMTNFVKHIQNIRYNGRKQCKNETLVDIINSCTTLQKKEKRELCLLGLLNNVDMHKYIKLYINQETYNAFRT